MSFLDNLGDLVKEATGGGSPDQVHATYDQVAAAVPQSTLADGLAHAFNSDQTPPFPQMVSGLFGQSNPDQKAGLLNQIISALGPAGMAAVASAVGGGGLASILTGGAPVTPAQASQVSPADVQVLAQHAQNHDASIVDTVAGFYAQHSTLVKAIGAGALAILMSKISQNRR